MSPSKCTGPNLSLSVNGNNQVTGASYGYDAAGNMTGDGQNSSVFNDESEIASANGVNYTYDGDGLRVEKSSGTLYWRSYTGEVLEETDTSGNMQRDYIFFAGRRIAWRDSSGYVYYYFADAIGNTRAATDASGNTCFSADYYPYGQENDYVTACSPTYKFTGYEYDSETGNYYAYARYYNPRLGRFIVNNPTNFVDPLGLFLDGCYPNCGGSPPCDPTGQVCGGGGTGGGGGNGNGCPTTFVAGRIGGLFIGAGPCGGRGGGGGGGTGGGKKQKQQVETDKNGVPCNQKILGRFNSQFGTNAPLSNTIDLGPLGHGNVTDNIDIFFPAGTLPFGQVQAGRFGGGPLGTGPTLHVVSFSVGPNPLVPGQLADIVQVHLDQGNPLKPPLGTLSHLDYFLTHSAGPCP